MDPSRLKPNGKSEAAQKNHQLAATFCRQRPVEEQKRVGEESSQLAIYCFKSCPYCYKADRTIAQLKLKVESRDIHAPEAHSLELFQDGDKRQVSSLRIPTGDSKVKWLYESNDIVSYLKLRFRTIT
ncbi:glutathione S-transferase N-terminal domain-containing protein [Candidatus Vondammii sp. HM_W22]|uniref:glutathione S-transferase N-terminal domain-containing protein n=1 Tax=Candidatus Vondammii sp. HM_W22 TaxID=2687299 RepID=UPI001F133C0E|nr:glutathione S-transferase N-terminal domain-containing protein [Candidatus Vondammii sp. HM_W22]